ncbi:MAG: tyrosine-type recombinase/integrase [Thermaerobacter sp.]|nr:tyrosine-type recombinase/integrase [Thermaerobacter sp.]
MKAQSQIRHHGLRLTPAPRVQEGRDYARVLKRAGLSHFRPHDMRHTMATLLLAEGVHPKIVQERLGHSRIDMTMDTYSRVLPNLQREAANRLDAVISGTRTGNRQTGTKKKR